METKNQITGIANTKILIINKLNQLAAVTGKIIVTKGAAKIATAKTTRETIKLIPNQPLAK